MYFSLCQLFLAVWSLQLSVVKAAGAPGDGDTFCTETLSGLGADPLPPSAGILMDSYDYLNLLPPNEQRAVWQQLDLDDNNALGRGTQVSAIHTPLVLS